MIIACFSTRMLSHRLHSQQIVLKRKNGYSRSSYISRTIET